MGVNGAVRDRKPPDPHMLPFGIALLIAEVSRLTAELQAELERLSRERHSRRPGEGTGELGEDR